MPIKPDVDTVKKIFKELYLCRIPNYKTMSVDYLKMFGTPTTFNDDIDRELSKELIKVMIPISQMIEYFKEGIVVRVVNEKDTLAIYEAISLHLYYWKEHLTKGLNTGNAPMEDLILMDQFANAVYPYASSNYVGSQVESIFKRKTKNSLMNQSSILNKLNKKIENKDAPETPERLSMADFFKDKSMGIRKW